MHTHEDRSLIRLFRPAPRARLDRRRVRWIGGDDPAPGEAALFREAIVDLGLATYGAITRCVADRLFRMDQAAGGELADIGLLHPWYVLHAGRSLERMRGRMVEIEDEGQPWR